MPYGINFNDNENNCRITSMSSNSNDQYEK